MASLTDPVLPIIDIRHLDQPLNAIATLLLSISVSTHRAGSVICDEDDTLTLIDTAIRVVGFRPVWLRPGVHLGDLDLSDDGRTPVLCPVLRQPVPPELYQTWIAAKALLDRPPLQLVVQSI